jgi:YVTN family beta-propeller protein
MLFTQNNSQNNSAGYVKYTLDLINNTLIYGNFVNTYNGEWPFGVTFDSANKYIYVTNIRSNNVSVINGTTNRVITNIGVGYGPAGVAFDSANGYIYVANSNSNNISVINGATNRVIANIGVGLWPFGVQIMFQ